jgi:hypothetical protein
MASRSDRQKVKWRGDRMLLHMDAVLRHAHELDLINDKRSPYINEKLPLVVTGIQLARDLIERFNENL